MTADPAAQAIRLFIGLPVPPDVARRWEAARRPLTGALWVAGADLHLTLRYLGDVAQTRLDEIDAALARVRKKPFSLVLSGMDVFTQPVEDVLYARVESARNVTDLCALVTERMAALGFDFGPRPFVPHVSLARVRRGGAGAYAGKFGKIVNYQWRVDRFMLYQSGGMQEGGGRYRVRAAYELRD